MSNSSNTRKFYKNTVAELQASVSLATHTNLNSR